MVKKLKIMTQVVGTASTLCALAVIISSVLMVHLTIKEKTCHELEHGGNHNNHDHDHLCYHGSELHDHEVNETARNEKEAMGNVSAEVQNEGTTTTTPARRHPPHDVANSEELQHFLRQVMLISSFGIVVGFFQLSLAAICCFAGRVSGRCLSGLWLLGDVICLSGIIVLLIVSWNFNDGFKGHPHELAEKYWFAFQLTLKIDAVVVLIFSVMACYASPKTGSSGISRTERA